MQGIWLLAFLVQWVLVLILAVLVVGILRYLHSVQERWDLAVPAISKYELQQQIDDFELPNVAGTKIKIRDVLRPSGAVILFATVRCSSCSALLTQVSELITRSNVTLARTIVIIVNGTGEQMRDLLNAYPAIDAPQVVLLSDEKGTVVQAFGVRAAPTGLEVDHEGRLTHQTFNPHAEQWLYKALEVAPPELPVVQGHVGIIVPTAIRNR